MIWKTGSEALKKGYLSSRLKSHSGKAGIEDLLMSLRSVLIIRKNTVNIHQIEA